MAGLIPTPVTVISFPHWIQGYVSLLEHRNAAAKMRSEVKRERKRERETWVCRSKHLSGKIQAQVLGTHQSVVFGLPGDAALNHGILE